MKITPSDLCDIEEIKQLKAAYFRFVDTKQWDNLRKIFTDDATFEGVHKPISGPDEFVDSLRGRLAQATTIHHGHMPEIRIFGPDKALGVWSMFDWVEFPAMATDGPFAGHRGFTGLGHYEERYRKENDVWKIAFLRLTRLKLDPLFGKGVSYDLPAGRLRSQARNWLEQAGGA